MPPKKAAASKPASSKPSAAPKSILDKVVASIRAQPPGPSGGVSRQTISKYLKAEFDYDNVTQFKQALKKGISSGILVQTGQSFSVKGDPERKLKEAAGEPLQMEDVTIGKGVEVKKGDSVTVAYVGKLDDETQFDAAKTFEFLVGAGDVIKGWDQGLVGMKVGGKRKLVVPSRLGYGKRGSAPDIPPNATLHFDITLKKISPSDE